ncbi:MAG: translation initiation factor IF-3 [Candidatus Levybacteria bacterium]|nr:translation initiation factor IF-3 [Candidatus Levybacteria bacterium]
MIKRHKRKTDNRIIYRINERIFAQQLRVLDADGKMVGLLSRQEGLNRAKEQSLDLVEVAPNAKPPVAKIVNFKKFLYQQEKKKREDKRKAKVSETKEIRLGPFMEDHDLNVRVARAREFLEDGDKVRLVLKFKGRQITHPEFGYQIINKTITLLSNISKVDREAHFEGKQLVTMLAPERKKNNDKEKNQEISKQAVQNNQDGQGNV